MPPLAGASPEAKHRAFVTQHGQCIRIEIPSALPQSNTRELGLRWFVRSRKPAKLSTGSMEPAPFAS